MKILEYLTGITPEWEKGWEKETVTMIEGINNRHSGKGTYDSGFRREEVERLRTKREQGFLEAKRQRVIGALGQWIPIAISVVALVVSIVALYRTW